jgi:hypothetical protein
VDSRAAARAARGFLLHAGECPADPAQVAAARSAVKAAKAHDTDAYYLGDAFGGYTISSYTAAGSSTAVVYGNCDPGKRKGSSCSPPLQVITMVQDLTDPVAGPCVRFADVRAAAVWALGPDQRPTIDYDTLYVSTADDVVTIAPAAGIDAFQAIASLQNIDGKVSPNDPIPVPSAATRTWLARNCKTAN